MIKTFRDKGLEKLLRENNSREVRTDLVKRVRVRLEAIDSATIIDDIRLPGYDLHALKGDRKGTWSIRVLGNWRITFQFQNGDVYNVDLEDYH